MNGLAILTIIWLWAAAIYSLTLNGFNNVFTIVFLAAAIIHTASKLYSMRKVNISESEQASIESGVGTTGTDTQKD